MGRFLFTTILANDLGVPSRSLPIALELERRGHRVAFCNPLDAPAKLLKHALERRTSDHARALESRPLAEPAGASR